MGFDTAARTGWYCLGTRARHCKATSFGRDGMRISDGASVVVAEVDMVFVKETTGREAEHYELLVIV